jgi:hypothetical protein
MGTLPLFVAMDAFAAALDAAPFAAGFDAAPFDAAFAALFAALFGKCASGRGWPDVDPPDAPNGPYTPNENPANL